MKPEDGVVAVVGATGYVGGRLTRILADAGYRVRPIGRSATKLAARPWASHPAVAPVTADLLDLPSLTGALRGSSAVFYLAHSMEAGVGDYARVDRQAARNMAQAARIAGIGRIIYLGGLGETATNGLSDHLSSRAEVAETLMAGTTPVTYLRAAMIIGAGSASFEIMRYLVDRLPVMITPKWVGSRVQPIAIRNVLGYLAGCLADDRTAGKTFDIGGPDVLTYRDLFDIYADEAKLGRRWIVPIPVLSPRLSSYWIHLVTPVPAAIARPLAEGLANDVVVTDGGSIRAFAPQELLTCREAIRLALDRVGSQKVETRWSDRGRLPVPEWATADDPPYAGGGLLQETWRVTVEGTPEQVWTPIARIGGETGWYFGGWLWEARGWIDRIIGGVGLRRGRRHPTEVGAGEALDFWRVVEGTPGKRLLLLAEMKLPGVATLDFRIEPMGADKIRLTMLARFAPRGLFGYLYWYAVKPFHGYVFRGMLAAIAKASGGRLLTGPDKM